MIISSKLSVIAFLCLTVGWRCIDAKSSSRTESTHEGGLRPAKSHSDCVTHPPNYPSLIKWKHRFPIMIPYYDVF